MEERKQAFIKWLDDTMKWVEDSYPDVARSAQGIGLELAGGQTVNKEEALKTAKDNANEGIAFLLDVVRKRNPEMEGLIEVKANPIKLAAARLLIGSGVDNFLNRVSDEVGSENVNEVLGQIGKAVSMALGNGLSPEDVIGAVADSSLLRPFFGS